MSVFHPDLQAGRYIPRFSVGPRLTRLMNRMPIKAGPVPDDVVVEDLDVPGPPGAPAVGVRVYRPRGLTGTAPALLWIHGGGMIGGSNLQDHTTNVAFTRALGITVASVTYRLAPEHPAPAAVEDSYAALEWLARDGQVDAERIAIGGASAGGGIAAGLAQLALDRGAIRPVFQLLVYPMLDDRTVLRTDLDTTSGSGRRAATSTAGRRTSVA